MIPLFVPILESKAIEKKEDKDDEEKRNKINVLQTICIHTNNYIISVYIHTYKV